MTDNSQPSSNVNEFNRFLNNNTGFIHEKYDYHYGQQFSISELLTQQKLEKSLKFIYDIFSFQKYEGNPKLNTVLRKGLTQNIQTFVQQALKDKKKQIQFNKSYSVKLLQYCIENNDMFAVQYDKKNKKKNQQKHDQKQPTKEEPIQQKKQIIQESKQEQIFPKQPENEVKPQPIHPVVPEAQPETVQTPKQSKIKQVPIRKQSPNFKEKVSEKLRFSNQFQENMASMPKQQNLQLIRKQLKNVFDFYCKQQQNVTPNSTFDIINHKCQTMNLGKFLFFAVATNIVQSKQRVYSEARLDKKSAISVYKRLAQGHRQIDFKIFTAIMQQIYKTDQKIYNRMGLGQQGGKGKSKIAQNLKYFNLPFSTRDQTRRQRSPHGRIFVPKLTTHSGKIQQSLKQQIVLRKQRPYFDTNDRMRAESKTIFKGKGQSKGPSYTLQDPKDTSMFTLKLGQTRQEGQHQNLKFLSKLIIHEENDQIFLKDYYLPPKKSALSNKQKGLEVTFEDSGRYTKQDSILTLDKQFTKNPGQFISRATKEQLVLPLIKQKQNKGMLTERRSLGVQKRNGYKL